MQTEANTSELSEARREELQGIIDWTFRHSDYVNPLTDLEWMLRQFKEPEWMYGG